MKTSDEASEADLYMTASDNHTSITPTKEHHKHFSHASIQKQDDSSSLTSSQNRPVPSDSHTAPAHVSDNISIMDGPGK